MGGLGPAHTHIGHLWEYPPPRGGGGGVIPICGGGGGSLTHKEWEFSGKQTAICSGFRNKGEKTAETTPGYS